MRLDAKFGSAHLGLIQRLPERTPFWIPGLGLLWWAGLAAGCSSKPPVPIAQLPVPVVTIEAPVQQDVQETYDTTGRISAIESVQVLPRVSGHIKEVAFHDGQRVKAGDPLFKIDPRPFQAALDQAEAQVHLEEARVLKTTADLSRQQELVTKKATTKEELDLAVAEKASAEALREQALAKVDSAKLDLEFATVTAPISGKTSVSTVKMGSLVGGTAASLAPLTTIVSTNPIHVYFNIDERTVLRIREQLVASGRADELGGAEVLKANIPLTIRLENKSMPPIVGVMDFVDNQVDPQTGTIRARGRFMNDPEVLTDGMFVRITMPIGKLRPALLIPERAIQANLGTKFIYVVEGENRARSVPISVGLKQQGLAEVIPTETGSKAISLTSSTKVITAGLQRVRDGGEVQPEDARPSAEGAQANNPAGAQPGKTAPAATSPETTAPAAPKSE